MKAAAFDYLRPGTLAEALALLTQHASDCKLLAGGQSLVPMMAMRLLRPALLIDINRLTELQSIAQQDGSLRMGAAVRQRDVEDATQLHAALPLVRCALRWVGHAQTRNRGTVGGSMVHADPSAELPLAAMVLGATLCLQSELGGEQRVRAEDFFLAPMFTATAEAQCLTAIEWPVWSGARIAAAFEETAIRHGDFAMAAAACQVQLNEDGLVIKASLGLGGVDGVPRVFHDIAAKLCGQRITAALAQEAAQAAAKATDPGSDIHASAQYRRHLAGVLLARALQQAAALAAGETQ